MPMMLQMYFGAVRVKMRQAKRMAGPVHSNCPRWRKSKYAPPSFTKNAMARIISSAGNTTFSTTLLICVAASFHVYSTAPATSPPAASAEVQQREVRSKSVNVRIIIFLYFKKSQPP